MKKKNGRFPGDVSPENPICLSKKEGIVGLVLIFIMLVILISCF